MRKDNKPNSKKTATKSRKGSTVQRTQDPLAPYRKKAQRLIELFFDPTTPPFIDDLLRSFFTRLEDQTQIFWNRRDVLEILLPIWLQDADNDDEDILSEKHSLYLDALHESITCNAPDDDFRLPGATRDDERAELEGDAEAIARLIHSKHTPPDLRSAILDTLSAIQTGMSDEGEVLKVSYPLAILRAERSASDETKA